VLLASLQALGALRPMIALDRLARPATRLLFIAALFAAGGRLGPALALEAGLPLVLAAVGVRVLRRLHPQAPGAVGPYPRTRALLDYSLPLFWSDALAQVRQFVPLALLAALHQSAAAGVYAVVMSVLRLNLVPRLAAGEIFLPRLALAVQEGDAAGLGSLHRQASRWTLFLMGPPTIACVLFPEAILGVFGADYVPGAPGLQVAAALTALASVTGPAANVLSMGGRTRQLAWNNVASLLLMSALSVALIPQWGVFGALLASSLTWVAQDLLEGCQAFLAHRVAPGLRATGVLLAAGGVAVLSAALLRLGLVAGLGVAAVAYLGVALAGRGVGLEDLEALRGLARRRR